LSVIARDAVRGDMIRSGVPRRLCRSREGWGAMGGFGVARQRGLVWAAAMAPGATVVMLIGVHRLAAPALSGVSVGRCDYASHRLLELIGVVGIKG
jgi:hypothetical protein